MPASKLFGWVPLQTSTASKYPKIFPFISSSCHSHPSNCRSLSALWVAQGRALP